MNSKEAREYVHLAGYECKGITRKALDIVLSDSEKLEKIEQIVNAPMGGKHERYNKIVEVLKQDN